MAWSFATATSWEVTDVRHSWWLLRLAAARARRGCCPTLGFEWNVNVHGLNLTKPHEIATCQCVDCVHRVRSCEWDIRVPANYSNILPQLIDTSCPWRKSINGGNEIPHHTLYEIGASRNEPTRYLVPISRSSSLCHNVNHGRTLLT